ncbi:pyridoxal-5'-phosphate-dependent enzyme, beta subunit [Hymenobacter roseosalivarius DSM 11622]|uniref:Pyridoxal-5'-phosphate-dependent enzyme, beta subunit n=1 Tax=Hymenobacter roseosalivarius DSM 11622 TaxID=645990 RepID=A0A1W1UZ17_9BACT|nr:pyridoxal-phosphate dependent enzyme [Hymenobacter roseosalivarius]SMB86250.1 pyridoxal-5'-phosphate-dependent enzyme, beta subunit [Hymenobacter roseosalivarius DSM 11622]
MTTADPIILQELDEPTARHHGIRLILLRDDLKHPELPGNKWRKLKYNLLEARAQGHDTLLTFGGAFSNHLAAVAAAGRLYGFRTIGVVRGESTSPLNPTLVQAVADGMTLRYLDRDTYHYKQEPSFQADLLHQTGPAYILPEGGTNELALRGCAELVTELNAQTSFDTLCVACGTGGTLGGFLAALKPQQQAVGVAALKNGGFLQDDINVLTTAAGQTIAAQWSVQTQYHFGGYAKFSPDLMTFIRQFQQRHGVLLDPLYTSKLLYGVLDLLNQDYFTAGSAVVAVHTGGLQAWAGFRARFEKRSSWWPEVA